MFASRGERSSPDGRVTCVLYGFGRINRAVLRLSFERPWLAIKGVLVRSGADRGKPNELVPGADPGLVFETDAPTLFGRTMPDVAIVATQSRLVDVLPHLRIAASASRAVLCTAEELAFVGEDSPVAAELMNLARHEGSRVVAVGVNPGFLFDVLPLALSGVAWTVDRLTVDRVVDVSTFAPPVRRHLGIGLTMREFEIGVADKSIAGHIGFQASLSILATRFGLRPEFEPVKTVPYVARRDVGDGQLSIPSGHTIGMKQSAVASLAGVPWLRLNLTFHASPVVDDLEPLDEIHIAGRHEVRIRIPRGIRPDLGTAGLLVNSIPSALRAAPGFYSAGSVGQAAPWLGHHRPP